MSGIRYDHSTVLKELHELWKETIEPQRGGDERYSYREVQREDPSHIAERSMEGCLEEAAFDMDLLR